MELEVEIYSFSCLMVLKLQGFCLYYGKNFAKMESMISHQSKGIPGAVVTILTNHTFCRTHALRSLQMFEVSYDIECCRVSGELHSFEHFCNHIDHTCPRDTVVNRNLIFGER